MENQLREMFMLYGAPNAWSEFVAIRTDIKKKRIAAIAQKKKEMGEEIENEGMQYGIFKGDGKPKGAMAAFGKKKNGNKY